MLNLLDPVHYANSVNLWSFQAAHPVFPKIPVWGFSILGLWNHFCEAQCIKLFKDYLWKNGFFVIQDVFLGL